MKFAVIIATIFLFAGCKRLDHILGTEKKDPERPHASYVVSCCRDNNNGILTYPSFVPPAHVQLCESARVACRTANCQINGDTYLPMNVDCGKWGYKIGDEYYAGRGY